MSAAATTSAPPVTSKLREMYRVSGPEELKSLGETEFVSGAAAMSK